MKNEKFLSILMVMVLSFTSFMQPLVAFGQDASLLTDEDAEEMLLDVDEATIETNEDVEEPEVEEEPVVEEVEVETKQEKEPVKNKGDPTREEEVEEPAKDEVQEVEIQEEEIVEEVVEESQPKARTMTRKGSNIKTHPKTEIPNKDSIASSKYAVIAKFGKNTKMTVTGVNVKTSNDGYPVIPEPKDSLKGKIKVNYSNIGTYNGKSLDFEMVLTDWKKTGFKGGEWIGLYDRSIGLSIGGMDYVSVKGTYKYTDTGKPATDLTGTYMTVNDLDAQQSLAFDKNMFNNIEKIYAYSNSDVSVWEDRGKTHVGALFSENIEATDTRGIVTFLVDGHQFNFDWVKNWHELHAGGGYYNFDKVIDWKEREYAQYFGYIAEKPVRTETLKPTKKVSDSDEKQVESNKLGAYNEKFTYDIYHTVPAEYKEFFYKKYVMEDEILDELKVESTKVFNSANKDVTNLFDVTVGKDNKVTFNAKKGTLSNASFYGEDYRYEIKVSIKESADLDKFLNDKGEIVLVNEAKVTIDGEGKPTNKVTTTPPVPTLPNTPIVKDVEGKQHLDVKHEKNYKYNVKTKIASHLGGYKEVTIKDTLDKRLDVVGAKVLVDGKASDFKANIKDQTVSVKFDRKQLDTIKGKEVNLQITAKIKSGTDIELIDNKATIQLNDDPAIDSNVVTVIPPKPVTPKVVKDVEEQEHLEVAHEKEYNYNVKTNIPTELGGHKDLTLVDTLDKRLDVVKAKVLVNGKETDFEADVKGQTVSVKFGRKQLETIAGKEVNLQITAKIQSGTDIELIDNKATIQLNDNPEVDSNVVTVIPPKPITPEIVKDVEGKEHLEVAHEKEYNYNVKTNIPAELGGYKELTLVDTLDERLDVLGAKVLVNGEETDFEAVVKDQTVSVKLDRKQLETIKGEEINLQITAKIQSGTDIELIDNKATIQLNDNPEVDSNVVTVIPPKPITPEVVKDVEEQEHLEVAHEKEYNYNVKTNIPTELGGYDNLTISDVLDERLDVVGVKVLVDGEGSDLEAVIEGQSVVLELNREQLNEIAGKEVNLQITAKIQSGTDIELIDNKATIQLNDDPAEESNVVTVIPPKPITPEIVKDVEGKEHLDIEREKNYVYNVKTNIPTELGGYKTMTITDALDKRLEVVNAKVLVDGQDSGLKANIKGQNVVLELDREQLNEIAGKEVNLQITSLIKGDVTDIDIPNTATLQLNDDPAVDSNEVTVSPIIPKDPVTPTKEEPKKTVLGKVLPSTATEIFNFLLIGAGLMVLGSLGYFFFRKKQKEE